MAGPGSLNKTFWSPSSVLFLAVGVIGAGGIGLKYWSFNNCTGNCAEVAAACIERVEKGEIAAAPAEPKPATGSALPVATKAPAEPEQPAVPLTPDEIETREITRCRSVQKSCEGNCNPLSTLAPD